MHTHAYMYTRMCVHTTHACARVCMRVTRMCAHVCHVCCLCVRACVTYMYTHKGPPLHGKVTTGSQSQGSRRQKVNMEAALQAEDDEDPKT